LKGKKRLNDLHNGTLYVVSTPIGNLEDLTFRAKRVLTSVNIIAAENISRTKKLCNYYEITTKIISCNQHNQKKIAPFILKKLESESDIAIVSDAGTPGISDPGTYLVSQAAKKGIRIIPVPGPCAVITSLSISGMPADRFYFNGFLSNKSGKRQKTLQTLIPIPKTLVFFEAPHRLESMLMDIKQVLGDRQIVMHREITKTYEEVIRGPVSTILTHIKENPVKGEITLVVEGNQQKKLQDLSNATLKQIDLLLHHKMSVKEISQLISQEKGLTYRRIYKECLLRKRALLNQSEEVNIANKLNCHK